MSVILTPKYFGDFAGDVVRVFDGNNIDSSIEEIATECLCGAKCVFVDGDDGQIEVDDYVTTPMIWCGWGYDGSCGGRFFFCPNCDPIVERSDNPNDSLRFTYQLLKVKSVVNSQIYKFKWTREKFDQHFEEFIKCEDYSHREQLASSFGVEEAYDCFDETSEDVPWEFAIECDSYNATDVKLPIDMSHDGMYIYCKCVCEKCGTESQQTYWGD